MKLYLVHCGFYDSDLCDGIYESHINFFVVADSFETARVRVKDISSFKSKRMHVDGMQEISAIEGYRVSLNEDASLSGQTLILSNKHRDLAPKTK